MKKYETPDMDLVYFDTKDVIATSGLGEVEIPGGGDIWEDDDE